MRSLLLVWLIAGCESGRASDLEDRIAKLEQRPEPKAASWHCVYVGPSEPVMIASCHRTVEACAASHTSGHGSCISAPFAFCAVVGGKESCFFEREYCLKLSPQCERRAP